MIFNLLLLAALTWALYGYTLRLPYFYDDLPITTWALTHPWEDLVLNHEGGYFRPVATAIHMLGTRLPLGMQQPALHLVNLLVLLVGAILIQKVCLMCSGNHLQAFSAGSLYIAFPFLATTVPWISALSHLLVSAIVALAAYFAIRAKDTKRDSLYALSFVLIFFATFVHESGAVAGPIVGGILLSQQFKRKWVLVALLMVGISLSSVWLRPADLNSSLDIVTLGTAGEGVFAKGMFFVQSLLYPIMPILGWLTRRYDWHDFVAISWAAGSLMLVMGWLVWRDRTNLRWILPSLIWWGVGALPAIVAFDYAALYVAPRLYTLGAAGCVILWSGLIVRLATEFSGPRKNTVVAILLVGAMVPGVVYIRQQRDLHTLMAEVYKDVASIVSDEENHPVGFVNLPHHVTWNRSMYPLIHDGVVFVPWYSNVGEFLRVNLGRDWGNFHPVIYGPAIEETDPFLGFGGSWIDAVELYSYAQEHQTIQLTQVGGDGSKLALRDVGSITGSAITQVPVPLVQYQGGPNILSATIEKTHGDEWTLTLLWESSGPVEAEIFVHVYAPNGDLVAQADGPALSGLIPLWVWRPNTYIRDVRHIPMPSAAAGPPYTIGVGIYNGAGRFPAFIEGQRAAGDVAIIAIVE